MKYSKVLFWPFCPSFTKKFGRFLPRKSQLQTQSTSQGGGKKCWLAGPHPPTPPAEEISCHPQRQYRKRILTKISTPDIGEELVCVGGVRPPPTQRVSGIPVEPPGREGKGVWDEGGANQSRRHTKTLPPILHPPCLLLCFFTLCMSYHPPLPVTCHLSPVTCLFKRLLSDNGPHIYKNHRLGNFCQKN